MFNKITFAVVTIIALIFLSGCTSQPPDTTGIQLNNPNANNQQAIQEEASENAESNSSVKSDSFQVDGTVQGAQTNVPAKTERKTGMQTLADFSPIEGNIVLLKTSKGDVKIQLFREEAPITTINFLTLVKDGFYNDIVFHRVIPGFMAQVGDPKTKDPSKQAEWGTGGPGYNIPDEFSPNLKHDGAGVVSMANSGPNSGGSQFFITYEATPWLDGKHAVFGKVIEGMEIVSQLSNGDKILSASIE